MTDPIIERAMRGEQISAMDIRKLGGFDRFQELLDAAIKAAKKPKPTSGLRVKTFAEYAAEGHPLERTYVKPDPGEPRQHLPTIYFYGMIFFVVVVLPFMVITSCGN